MKRYGNLSFIKGNESELQSIIQPSLFYAEDSAKTFLLNGTSIEELGGGGAEFIGLSETGSFEDFDYTLSLGNPDGLYINIDSVLNYIEFNGSLEINEGYNFAVRSGVVTLGLQGSKGELAAVSNTANRTYNFPDWSGTVVLSYKSGILPDANYTLVESDSTSKIFEMAATSPRTFTIPQASSINYAFGFGTGFKLINKGSANITITTFGTASLLGGDYTLLPNKMVTVFNYIGNGESDNWVVED